MVGLAGNADETLNVTLTCPSDVLLLDVAMLEHGQEPGEPHAAGAHKTLT